MPSQATKGSPLSRDPMTRDWTKSMPGDGGIPSPVLPARTARAIRVSSLMLKHRNPPVTMSGRAAAEAP